MYVFSRYLNIRSAVMPVLSPDGSRVAFLSDISGNYQVWSVSTDSSRPAWPQQLTHLPDKVWELHGTANANHLIAVSDIGGNEFQQLYLITGYGSEEHDVRRLTENDKAIHRFGAWSRDARRIVYTSNARNKVDFDLYQMDLLSGEERLIHQTTGNRVIIAWSPDGQYLLSIDSVGPLQDALYLFDLHNRQERHLTADAPQARYEPVRWISSGIYAISDRLNNQNAICHIDPDSGEIRAIVTGSSYQTKGELHLLSAASNGEWLAYTFNANGYSRLYLLNLTSGETQPIPELSTGVINTLRFSKDSRRLVLDFQTPNNNPDVWLVNVADRSFRRLTHSDRAGIPRSSFVLPRQISYRSFDELEIPAFYYLPQSEPPPGGYPCIFYVHGGPTHQTFADFDVRFQYFLSQGYAVFAPNVRGSSGYGRTYAGLDEIEKRLDSVADLKAGVNWLYEQAEINGERIAIYGRSYGGYMVLAALTEYPELFAAGVDVVGIANWVTFMERTGAWRRAHRQREYGSLEHHRGVLERISPIHKAGRITVPLMVVAGDNDPRVPLYESEQIVERVREAGGVVKFVHYADEGHKISKLRNRIDSFTQMAGFLREHL